MNRITKKELEIFYGGTEQATHSKKLSLVLTEAIFLHNPFLTIKKTMHLEYLVALRQMHGNKGLLVQDNQQLIGMPLCSQEGDFLITSCKNVGLAILTADCLPLIFWDSRQDIIANVHAGWRGSIALIVQMVVERMQNSFGTKVKNLEVFFGPCAKICCYEVKEDFIKQTQHDLHAQYSLSKRGKEWYFDIVKYNKFKLQKLGIPLSALHFENNHCTMCSPGYCSFRKQEIKINRNITIVSLK